jgi:hypothetical protein
MSFEEAVKVLESKGYRVHATMSEPSGSKSILYTRRGKMRQASEQAVIELASSYNQASLEIDG